MVEEMKRNEPGLHQLTSFYLRVVTMERSEKKVVSIEIILSKTELDKGHPGYQSPLPDSKVTRLAEEQLKEL